MTLSTHVLDTGLGLPAAGLPVFVDRYENGSWQRVAAAETDESGRASDLLTAEQWSAARWRLVFDTGSYLGPDAFWPQIVLDFAVSDPTRHHHIPLLLSRYGYSTYRGS
jgi:5-hydroxyisourate hydrolase